jgi:hypothetical protein
LVSLPVLRKDRFVRDDQGKIGVRRETVNCLLREGLGEERGNLEG